MYKLKCFVLLIVLFLSFALPLQAQPSVQKIDAMIQQGMKDWKIPGLAAVIVKDDKVVFKKVYGVKNLESKEAVDENTLFNMGSTTKAIIAMSIGILVDQGKLDWEDKVRDHLPSFQLSDPYVTADARIKDLLTHNLGMGNADLLWYLDSVSTEETLRRFRLAERVYPLRGGYIYQNIMYAVAGEVIKAVSGQHWTTFVDEHILQPLEMDRTQTKVVDIIEVGNYVTPYYDDPWEGIVSASYNFSDQIGAAGMIWTSAEDVSHYLQFLVNGGVFNGDTLLQPSTFHYLFKPHAIIDQEKYPTQRLVKPNWMTYGLGWFQQDYRGKKLDFHTGSVDGLIAIAGIMHDEKTAVYVLANLDHAELRHAILYKAIDLYAFDDDSRDWHQDVYDLYAGLREASLKQLKQQEDQRVLNTKPSLPLDDYLGNYRHAMLGQVKISSSNGKLAVRFNDKLTLIASHWNYDTFVTERRADKPYTTIHFLLNEYGEVRAFEVFGETFVRVE